MHLAFTDESGDLGSSGSPTRFFILCSVMVRHDRWEDGKGELTALRERLRMMHGLHPEVEIHAGQFLGGDVRHRGLDVRSRYQCAHHIVRSLRQSRCLGLARHAVSKEGMGASLILSRAWQGLAQAMVRHACVADFACGGRGWIIVSDHHGDQPYRDAAMARFLSSQGQPLLDHPFGRRSHDSQFLQVADLLSFLTKQSLEPNHHFGTSQGRSLVNEVDLLFGSRCPISAF